MSAPEQHHIAYGTPDAYREFIAETLARAEIYTRLGQGYIDVADDAGLDHACRCLTACVRSALSVLGDLKQMKAEQAARQGAASAAPCPRSAEARP